MFEGTLAISVLRQKNIFHLNSTQFYLVVRILETKSIFCACAFMLKCKLRCSSRKTKNCLLSDKHLCLCLLTISGKSKTLSKYEQKNSANDAKCAQMLTLLSH